MRDLPPKITRKKEKHQTLLDSQKTLLEGFINCGPTKVKALIDKFCYPLAIFQAIETAKPKYSSTGRIKGVEGALGCIEGIGPEFILQNQELFITKLNKSARLS